MPSIDILPPSFSPELEAAPPPAYSIAPDVNGGELVVQQGPRRPFQPAPEPFLPLPAPQVPQQELQPPQQQQRQQPRFAPPPGPPPGVSRPTSERPHSQLSSFAQEFYSAGAATPDESPQQPRYAPPPGAPPPRPRAASTSSGAGSTAPPASDGRPTTTPTPGHPLLRNGQTLMYPDSYSCHKCTALDLSLFCLDTHPLLFPDAIKVTIRVTRTMIRRTRAASAGTASASHSRRFSPRARGVREAGRQVRTSAAAPSSARYPRSSLRRRARHHARLCLAHIHRHPGPHARRVPALGPCPLARCRRQAQLSSCLAIHVSAAGCVGDVVDAGRLRF
jgi:hypothetical protein